MVKRYWAFQELTFDYEGFYIPELYKALWNFVSDRGYYIEEFKYGHGFYGETNGAVGGWICTKEVEKKFIMNGMYIYWKLVWSPAPDPNNPDKKIPKGVAKIMFRGFVNYDYLSIWTKSPILRPFSGLKERYFYRNKIKFHMQQVRADAEAIIRDLREFVNFLPRIS